MTTTRYRRELRLTRRSTREPVDCLVGIEFDAEALAELLGSRALANKSRRSALLGGIIKAQVKERP
jgi:hypothetical protein